MGKIVVYVQSLQTAYEMSKGAVIATFVLSFAIVMALYLLRSLGVYKLAERNGISKKWMAWFPGLWIYPTCMLVAEYRFFGPTFKKLAVWFTVAITTYEVLIFVYDFILYFPIVGYYLNGGVVYFGEGATSIPNVIAYWTGDVYVTNIIKYPYQNIYAILSVLNIVGMILNILSFAEALITLNLYFALFRKFWPKHYIVASIVSFFGLFPLFVFIVRNNRPIDYASYVRSRYQGYYDVYTPNQERPPRKEKSPFDEYPNKEEGKFKYEDPFDEFSDKK